MFFSVFLNKTALSTATPFKDRFYVCHKMGWVINIYFMPVCRIVKLLPLCNVDDLMDYCTRPSASFNSASGCPQQLRVIVLTILQRGMKKLYNMN